MIKQSFLRTFVFVITLQAFSWCNAAVASKPVELFPLADVRLLDSPFKHAQDKNVEYILALQPDKLLAPFLKEAGLPVKAENYGNWESQGLDGHIGGHYLTALSLAYAATGDKRLLERLNYMLNELERAQNKNGNGYIGGVRNGKALWDNIAKGDIRADLFALNDYWVPWYNLHKIYAGLRDAYIYTGSEKAKAMLIGLGEWTIALTADLNDAQIEKMLTTEYGGMNEVLADMAAITGDKRYLNLAKQFSHKKILNPLLQERDALNGLHANTQIPKVVGYQRVAELTGDKEWHKAADYFWHHVVNNRTVAIGGNSVREHFHDSEDFAPMINDVEGPETCNTYNMLKLSRMLFSVNPSVEYVDYFERALYNHILSSQHPETGGLVYFTPMRPQHYRMYSQVDTAMWCCVGSGIENHVKYGEFIYAKQNNNLYVNLFIASTLAWQEKGVHLTQENTFPDSNRTTLTVALDSKVKPSNKHAKFAMHIRYPSWAQAGEVVVKVNGKPINVKAKAGEYIEINRRWHNGDNVELSLPMNIALEALPDQSDYYAVLYGPIVLAAKTQPFKNEELNVFADESRMGHIAQAQMCSLDAAPIFVSDSRDFKNKIKRVNSEQLVFKTQGLIQPAALSQIELIPFFRLHDSRYMLYWPYSSPDDLQKRQQLQAQVEAKKLALAQQTIDKVAPGEQQPESDHFFKGEATEAGVHSGKHWRHAHRWFSYQLNDPNKEGKILRITYYGLDAGRSFSIWLDDIKVADVTLNGDKGDAFYSVDYMVPKRVLAQAKAGKYRVKFQAEEGSVAGGIYGVRLMR